MYCQRSLQPKSQQVKNDFTILLHTLRALLQSTTATLIENAGRPNCWGGIRTNVRTDHVCVHHVRAHETILIYTDMIQLLHFE